MNKSFKYVVFWIAGGLVLLLVIVIFIPWTSYWMALKSEENKWKKETFIPSSYRGLVELRQPQYCFVTLAVKTSNGVESYGICICNNKEFKDFVEEGDSAIKIVNSEKFKFKKKDGREMEFELPWCSDL